MSEIFSTPADEREAAFVTPSSEREGFTTPPADAANDTILATLGGKSAEELSRSDVREADFAAEHADYLKPEQRDLLKQSYALRRKRGITVKDVAEGVKNAPAAVGEFVKGASVVGHHVGKLGLGEDAAKNAAELSAATETGLFNFGSLVRGAVKLGANYSLPGLISKGVSAYKHGGLPAKEDEFQGELFLHPTSFFKKRDFSQEFDDDVGFAAQHKKLLAGQGETTKDMEGSSEVDPEKVGAASMVLDPTNVLPLGAGATAGRLVSAGKIAKAAEGLAAVGNKVAAAGKVAGEAAKKVGAFRSGQLGTLVSLAADASPVVGAATGAGAVLGVRAGAKLVTHFGEALANPKLTMPALEYGARIGEGALHGGAVGGVFGATMEDPRDQAGVAAGGVAFGAAGAAAHPFAAKAATIAAKAAAAARPVERAVSMMFRAVKPENATEHPAFGVDPALDADHAAQMAELAKEDPDTANFINHLRPFLAKIGKRLYQVSDDVFADRVNKAAKPGQKNDWKGSDENLPYGVNLPDGTSLLRTGGDAAALFHEPGHALIQAMSPDEQASFFAGLRDQYSPEVLEQFRNAYSDRLNG